MTIAKFNSDDDNDRNVQEDNYAVYTRSASWWAVRMHSELESLRMRIWSAVSL